MITLTILAGPQEGETLTLQGDRIEIGRGTEGDLVLNDRSVSRRHCVIERQEDHFIVTDLRSANSTFLNGDRTAPVHTQRIQANDELTLGFLLGVSCLAGEYHLDRKNHRSSTVAAKKTLDKLFRIFVLTANRSWSADVV